QPVEALDDVPGFVEPLAGERVHDGTDAGALGTEETTVGADSFEEQFECAGRVEHRVVIQISHAFGEALDTAADSAGFKAGELVGDGPAAVRNEDLQCRKIIENIRI